jgi:hypothetical protein
MTCNVGLVARLLITQYKRHRVSTLPGEVKASGGDGGVIDAVSR